MVGLKLMLPADIVILTLSALDVRPSVETTFIMETTRFNVALSVRAVVFSTFTAWVVAKVSSMWAPV